MEKRKIFGFNVSEEDLKNLVIWCNNNNCQVSWLLRRLIKEFIKKNIDDTIKIEPIEINSGASKEKRGFEWVDLK